MKKLDGDYQTSLPVFLQKLTKKTPTEKMVFEASYNLSGFVNTLLKMQMEKKYGKTI